MVTSTLARLDTQVMTAPHGILHSVCCIEVLWQAEAFEALAAMPSPVSMELYDETIRYERVIPWDTHWHNLYEVQHSWVECTQADCRSRTESTSD